MSSNEVAPAVKADTINAKMWAALGDAFFPCEQAVAKLDAGQYTIDYSHDRGVFFAKKEVNLDDLLILPDSATEAVLAEIGEFWKREEIYRKYRYLWKRGILLWGPPGSGKTTTVQLISKRIVELDGIAVYVSNPKLAATGLKYLRKIEPKRPVVVMLEDLDTVVNQFEGELLALLDGELQIDNVVFVATTNYPEKLDPRIVNRPSRFDLVKKVPMPNAAARRLYLLNREPSFEKTFRSVEDSEGLKKSIVEREALSNHIDDIVDRLTESLKSADLTDEQISKKINGTSKLTGDDAKLKTELISARKALKNLPVPKGTIQVSEVDYWVGLTEGFSVAHLKEVVLGVQCFGKTVEEVVRRMRAMMGSKPSSSRGDAGYT